MHKHGKKHNYIHYVESGGNLKSNIEAIRQIQHKQRLVERGSKKSKERERKGKKEQMLGKKYLD